MNLVINPNHGYRSHLDSKDVETSQKLITAAIDMPFNACSGGKVQAYGGPEKTGIPVLDAIGARRHFIKGDGSCWARALWQCTFSQVLDNEFEFEYFIDRIANPEQGFEKNPFQKEAIHILYHLKRKSPAERLDYLNHKVVDETLIYFMRGVAADFMEKKGWGTPEEREEIRHNIHKYGAQEITAFANYFKLELHRVAQRELAGGEKDWTYYYKDKSATYESHKSIQKEVDCLVSNCMFGANDVHYEFLSFDLSEFKQSSPSEQFQKQQEFKVSSDQCCGELSKKILEERKAQIEADRKLAEKLATEEVKGRKDQMQMHQNSIAARCLQNKLNQSVPSSPKEEQKNGLDFLRKEKSKSLLERNEKKGFFSSVRNLFGKFASAISTLFSAVWAFFFSKNDRPQDKSPLLKKGVVASERISLIKKGSQIGCDGPVDSAEVDEKVMVHLADKVQGVVFQRKYITSVEGGTCSAMSLNFLRRYFSERAVIHESHKKSSALAAIQRIADKEIFSSSGSFRNVQAAFNQIRLTDSSSQARRSLKSKRKKIEALSGFYGLSVEYCSDEFDMKQGDKERFKTSVQGLVDGVYALRQIKEDDSDKGEAKGHTTAVIKEGEQLFLYDPNVGVVKYDHVSGEDLLQRLKEYHDVFDVNKVRFYKLKPKDAWV